MHMCHVKIFKNLKLFISRFKWKKKKWSYKLIWFIIFTLYIRVQISCFTCIFCLFIFSIC